MDSSKVVVLDIRFPTLPVEELSEIAGLPVLPDVRRQLCELRSVAVLAADQVARALDEAGHAVDASEREQQQIARAVHHAAFDRYLDVDQPRALIRSLAAA